MNELFSLKNLVYLQNPWFNQKGIFPKEKYLPKRDFYYLFKKLVFETKQISALIGIRRVGKTVILKQILSEIFENPSHTPLYFSFDQEIIPQLKNPLSQIIDFYFKNILKKPVYKINKPVYLFFDEIQVIPFWQDTLKRYYDLNQNIKFIISGSSSLFLKEKSKESLAGRIFEMTLPPLTFSEYKKINLIKPGDEEICFEDYLNYGNFFETIELVDIDKKKEFLKEWVLGKVLERDLPSTVRVVDFKIFKIIFDIFLQTTTQITLLNKIAYELELSATTLSNYFSYLEKTLLLSSVFNLAGSFVRRERRLRKIYPASSNFIYTLPNFSIGSMVETYVFNFLKQVLKKEVFFFKQRALEVDFIIPDIKTAVEVKYQNKIHQEDFKNLRLVMKKKKYQKGYLISKTDSGEKDFPEGKIVLIPAYQLENKLKIKTNL